MPAILRAAAHRHIIKPLLYALLGKLSILLVALASTTSTYTVTPVKAISSPPGGVLSVSSSTDYPEGYRFTQAQINALLASSTNAAILSNLIGCESQGVNVVRMDSNNKLSYGILQFQSSTWNDFSQRSRISGSPTDPSNAIAVADWAISNGFLGRWTCAHILKMVK